MKNFDFVIRDEVGIHARPAGLLVKKAGEFTCSIMLEKGGKTADARRLFAVMSLAAKQGDTVRFTFDGADENQAADAFMNFCSENL